MTLEKVLRGAVIAGVFALPFIPFLVAQTMFFPFITGKNFTFRIIVEVIFALWLALALVNPEYRPRRSWILYAVGLFVLMIGISDALGENPLKSFWSNYERMEGWVTLAHLFALLVVLTSTLTTEKLWRRFWHTSIAVSVFVGFYGIFQLMGWITINQGGLRLDATFGNAIYLGIYMLFHLFLTALMWVKAWRTAQNRWGIGLGYGAAMFLQAFILFFTASRGAMLGLIGGAFLAALLLVILSSQSKNAWRASVGVVAGILALTGVFFLVKDAAFMQSIVPLQRLSSISLSENTIASRFMNIGMATQGIKEHPIFGWGQENYNLVFNTYYDPGMFRQEQWFDRTHNIVFDWLIAGGLVGFAAYMLIYITALAALWRSGAFSVAERSILTGLLAAYFFSILFVFDNITSYIMFMLVLGYIGVRANEAGGYQKLFSNFALPRNTIAFTAAGAVLLAGGTAYAVNWQPFMANRTLIQALQPKDPAEGGLQTSIGLFKKALAYDTYGNQEIREQLVQGVANLANSSLSAEEKEQVFIFAVDEIKKQIESAPEDARFPYFLGVLHQAYGKPQEAKAYYEQALSLSPRKQTMKLQFADTLLTLGDTEGALAILKSAHEDAPQFPELRAVYASVLIHSGRDAEADAIIAPLFETGEAVDQRLINAYLARNRFDKIAKLWESKVRVDPQNVQARLALAASYYAAGQKQKSIEVLEQTAKDMPESAAHVRPLIQQVQDGTIQVTQ